MKKISFLFAFLAIMASSYAQNASVDNGIKMYQYQKYATAQSILSQFAASDARANYYLGLAQLASGDAAKALQTFQKFADDPANISGTARVAFANKEVNKGMSIAKDLAGRAGKKDWQPLRYAADALTYSEGADYNQAIAWYKEILAKKVVDADVNLGLGDAYRKIQGGGGEAMNNYETVTGRDAKNSLGFTRIGDLWYDATKYDLALESYSKAKDADATNPLPYKSLAYAFWRSGNYEKALTNIRTYLQLSDRSTDDTIDYMEILYQSHNYCEAKDLAKKFMQAHQTIRNKKAELYGILGFSQAYCNDSVAAVPNFRLYFQYQDPKYIRPLDYIEFGKLWLKLDNLDSAAFYYLKGIAGDTSQNKVDIYRQIAEAYRLKKQWSKSAEWYETIIKANPNTQALDYFYRGLNYFYNSDLDKAVSSFSDFENKYANQPSAIYWHARSLAAIDSEAKNCTASPSFQKWLTAVGGVKYEKKKELKIAYEYLLLCAYNSENKEEINANIEAIKSIDPSDALMLQIEQAEKGGTKKPKKK